MSQSGGDAIIGPDAVVIGRILNARRLEVRGRIEGEIAAEHLVVAADGQVRGTVKSETAHIAGSLQGHVTVRNLIDIADGGSVSGQVRYGRLALAEGGDLAADVRNVPPELEGDFEIVVRRGRWTRITTSDITAYDPDNAASELTFLVHSASGGHLAMSGAMQQSVLQFSQADLEAGQIHFVHDPAAGETANFAVNVVDGQGAISGAPRTVTVAVVE